MAVLHSSPYIEVGAMWFPMQGFRPAIWTPPHRGDQVDPDRLVPAPDADEAYAGKFDLPADQNTPVEGKGYGFVVWPDAVVALATASPTPTYASIPPDVFNPFPPIVVCCRSETPATPPTEQPNLVALEAGAAVFLLSAMTLLYGRRLWRAAGRFGDWFTAERGTGPEQNGWV